MLRYGHDSDEDIFTLNLSSNFEKKSEDFSLLKLHFCSKTVTNVTRIKCNIFLFN